MARGLLMAEAFFEEYGMPMLENKFNAYLGEIAAGLVGQGSECFGYDDRISMDHDYEPGFCLWLPEELKKQIGAELQKEYEGLPVNEFLVRHRADYGLVYGESLMTGARAHRIGVHSIEEFYYERTGITHAPQTTEQWMKTPQMYLSEAVNGKVFFDGSGKFSEIRSVWQGFYPEDILKKKVAADCAMAGKTGQFNYERSLRRGDIQAAHNCCEEFIYKITAALFLLNKTYMPYYKWRFYAMKNFSVCKDAAPLLCELTQLNEEQRHTKISLMERISKIVIEELKSRGWTSGYSDYLLDHAKLILKTIKDPEIASWNVFTGED